MSYYAFPLTFEELILSRKVKGLRSEAAAKVKFKYNKALSEGSGCGDGQSWLNRGSLGQRGTQKYHKALTLNVQKAREQ